MRGQHPLTRGSPNGETLPIEHRERPAESIGGCEPTQGSEPSQYLEEKKATAIPSVAASERGTAQTGRSILPIADLPLMIEQIRQFSRQAAIVNLERPGL